MSWLPPMSTRGAVFECRSHGFPPGPVFQSQISIRMKPPRFLQSILFQSISLLIAGTSCSFAVEANFRYYRFLPVRVRDNGTEIQLTEFRFFLAGAPVSYSGVTVTNPGGSNLVTAAQGASKAIDGIVLSTNKWFDNKSQPLVFDFGSAKTIDSYNFNTGNDFAGRDPVSWRIQGGNDGTTWTNLDIINGNDTTTARNADSATFILPAQVKPQIGSFGATVGGKSAGVVLNGTMIDLAWTSIESTTATLTSQAGPVSGSGGVAVTPPANAQTPYTLTVSNPAGSDTSTLTVRTVIGGKSTFQYIRFTPTKIKEATAGSIQLAEMYFYNNGASVLPTSVTNPGGLNAVTAAEGANKVFDRNTATKWLDSQVKPLVFNFGAPVTIDAYGFASANDFPGRDPVQWKIEGSMDSSSWTVIDDISTFDYPFPRDRLIATQDIPLPGPSLVIPVEKPFLVTAFSVDLNAYLITLKWTSVPGRLYSITQSANLASWSEPLQSGISGATGATETSVTLSYNPASGSFFRVVQQPF